MKNPHIKVLCLCLTACAELVLAAVVFNTNMLATLRQAEFIDRLPVFLALSMPVLAFAVAAMKSRFPVGWALLAGLATYALASVSSASVSILAGAAVVAAIALFPAPADTGRREEERYLRR